MIFLNQKNKITLSHVGKRLESGLFFSIYEGIIIQITEIPYIPVSIS